MKINLLHTRNIAFGLIVGFLSLLLVFSLCFAGFSNYDTANALEISNFFYGGANYFEIFSNNMSGFSGSSTIPNNTLGVPLYRSDNNTIRYNNYSNDSIVVDSPYYFKKSNSTSYMSSLCDFTDDGIALHKYNAIVYYLYNYDPIGAEQFNFAFNIHCNFAPGYENTIPQGYQMFIRIYDYYNNQDTLVYTINMTNDNYNATQFNGFYQFNNSLGSYDIWFSGIPHITIYSNFDNFSIDYIGLGEALFPVDPSAMNIGFNKGYSSGLNGFETATNDYTNIIDITTLEQLNSEYNRGFNNGYAEASANTNTFLGLFSAVVEAPLHAVLTIFDFEILGYNMKNFLSSLITIAMVLFIIKFILGNFGGDE